ncbi:MAG: DNA translocase FtsK 4TM domain-containing protein [Methylotenera sp.]|nr:DNA translocase FtsK 4TM domain-containing protein [Methylotenera sp.]MDP1754221.1 DNA translocase FtsK 4TM domain-containing protein [Methylotenera sp.]MDP1958884.1 DNA translocase FtsK 4TM domain-containing protein [Methylotenera sp.]MDP3206864.1 DNA translocase FtsK 4TM domain-containing protein [Methylotenera sp.]MDP3303439.1 DNA translocase FtsK 4TM domain-containing protein [Methylotenera sp.]
MFFKKSTPANARREAEVSKPNALANTLIKEAWWLGLVLVGLYITVILFTYHPDDSSWSHMAPDGAVIHNSGGSVGAWLSDLMLYIFGFSAWWWAVLAFYAMWFVYLKLEIVNQSEKPFLLFNFIGFALLLIASSALEAGHLVDLPALLPLVPGGMLGGAVDNGLRNLFGYTGSSMLLLLMFVVGFSLFTGWSWIVITEKFGTLLMSSYAFIKLKWQDWQDRKAGKVVELERKVFVQAERKRSENREPVFIEPPVLEVAQSERVQKEKQVPLFETMPDSMLPPLHLLDEPSGLVELPSAETLDFTSRLIERKLMDFGIEVKVLTAQPGPVITRFELEPAAGVKGSQVTNLIKDLARALSVVSVRVVETIPGKTCMGLEIPNAKRQIVHLSEIMSSQAYADIKSPLAISLGKDIAGKPAVADLAKMPHVLVAGTTGSGKSVAINALILSWLYKADASQVRMILIDPKMLELSVYEGIPHLLAPVVTDMRQAANALNWCVAEMERRYKLMSMLGVRNLAGYNQKIRDADKVGEKIPHPFSLTPDDPEPLTEMPLIVVVIDELADLMMVVGKKVEELIARLAQKARASGIHLVLATQRPSVDVITGLIKANVPTRISFQVSSKIDSRTILDQMGAEALLGQGDMLYMPPGTGYPVRIHGAFVSDQEVHKVVNYLKAQGEPNYIEGILTNEAEEGGADIASVGASGGGGAEVDPLYDEAVGIVLKTRRASISSVQRQLRIGYNRAARLIEDMERAGLVSAMQTNGNREVLAPHHEA